MSVVYNWIILFINLYFTYHINQKYEISYMLSNIMILSYKKEINKIDLQ